MMTETQWKVTWFPYDKEHVVRDARSKRHAHEVAFKHEMFNPLIESREVVTGDWEVYRGMPPRDPATIKTATTGIRYEIDENEIRRYNVVGQRVDPVTGLSHAKTITLP